MMVTCNERERVITLDRPLPDGRGSDVLCSAACYALSDAVSVWKILSAACSPLWMLSGMPTPW